jgi:hypothetical protein
MYRKQRSSEAASVLNLDSLMDILSCLVGVMLFLVIYTVLELGSTSFEVSVPTPRDRPVQSRRIIVVANAGTVRILDSDRPIRDLLTGVESIDIDRMAGFVRQMNTSPPTDGYFRYLLGFDEEAAVLDGATRAFEVEIREITGETGDGLGDINEDSKYVALLDALDPQRVWLEFAVDSASLNVFRRARDVAEQRGFATRWEPHDMAFPVSFRLSDNPGGPPFRTTRSKPER